MPSGSDKKPSISDSTASRSGSTTESLRFEVFSRTALRGVVVTDEVAGLVTPAMNLRLNYLHDYLSDLGATTIIAEGGYIDADYLEDFAAYYARCFHPYARDCVRLHFFSRPFSKEEFLSILLSGGRKRKRLVIKSYLGFIVVRPLPQALIGRTVLQPRPRRKDAAVLPCLRTYRVHLCGLEMSVQSLAYQEQDTVMAACATVSVWTCLHKAGELFSTPMPRPSEITKAAGHDANGGRSIPSHALDVRQICTAIRAFGLEPELYDVNNDLPLGPTLYAYLSMGLPVIIGAKRDNGPRHAIVVNGYSLRPRAKSNTEADVEVMSSSQKEQNIIRFVGDRMCALYGHDDQVGPFVRHEISFGTTEPDGPVLEIRGSVFRYSPTVIVVPIYHKIRLTFLDVIRNWIPPLHGVLRMFFSANDLEWDVQLMFTNDYKASLHGKAKGALSEQHRLETMLRPYPRFIWRAILRWGVDAVAEAVFDATSFARAYPVISVRVFNREVTVGLQKILSAPELKDVLNELASKGHEAPDKLWSDLAASVNGSA